MSTIKDIPADKVGKLIADLIKEGVGFTVTTYDGALFTIHLNGSY